MPTVDTSDRDNADFRTIDVNSIKCLPAQGMTIKFDAPIMIQSPVIRMENSSLASIKSPDHEYGKIVFYVAESETERLFVDFLTRVFDKCSETLSWVVDRCEPVDTMTGRFSMIAGSSVPVYDANDKLVTEFTESTGYSCVHVLFAITGMWYTLDGKCGLRFSCKQIALEKNSRTNAVKCMFLEF